MVYYIIRYYFILEIRKYDRYRKKEKVYNQCCLYRYSYCAFLFVFQVCFRYYFTDFICKKTPLKRGLVSALSVLFAFAVIISGLVLVLIWVGSEFKGFFQYIMIEFEDMPALIHKIEGYIANAIGFLPEKLESTVMDFISEKLATLTTPTVTPNEPSASIDLSMLSTPLKGIWNTAKQIPTTLVSIVVAIVACCFMTADFASVKKLVLGFFQPDTRTKIVRAKRLLFPSLGKMAKAYGIIITITFCELSLGLFLLKLMGIYDSGYIFVIAILTAIIDIVPVLGTGTVLIPWAVISLLNANYPLAIGLIVMYACITVIRQIIEPKLVAAQLGIPAFLTIVSMFIGSQIFGVIGIFILPITIVMLKLLNDEGIIHIFHYTDNEDVKAEEKTDEKTTEKAEVTQKND